MKTLPILALGLFLASASGHAKPGWLTDFQQAKDEARTKNKLLLVDFTGSDWCGFCIKLEREVFSQPKFKEYASKNLILLEVDFPRRRELSASELKQNFELADRFGIQGYPTIIVLDSEGKALGALGYDSGLPDDARELKATPEAFIASLEKLRKS